MSGAGSEGGHAPGPPPLFPTLDFLHPDGLTCTYVDSPAHLSMLCRLSLLIVNLWLIPGSKNNCTSGLVCAQKERSSQEATTSPGHVFGTDGWGIPGTRVLSSDLDGKYRLLWTRLLCPTSRPVEGRLECSPAQFPRPGLWLIPKGSIDCRH